MDELNLQLTPNPNWYVNVMGTHELRKARLRSPWLYDNVNLLPDNWKWFAHAVHKDIYENYESLTEQVHSVFRQDMQDVTLFDYWYLILNKLEMHWDKLPDLLKHIIFFHN